MVSEDTLVKIGGLDFPIAKKVEKTTENSIFPTRRQRLTRHAAAAPTAGHGAGRPARPSQTR